jgi:hypothetical protein
VIAANAAARAASARGVVVAVVDAGQERHREHRRQPRGPRVLDRRREHLVEIVGRVDRHQRAPHRRPRAGDREPERTRGASRASRRIPAGSPTCTR